MIKKLLMFLFMSLFLISLTYAIFEYDNYEVDALTTDSGWSNQATWPNYGAKFQTNKDNVTLFNVTKPTGVGADSAYLCVGGWGNVCYEEDALAVANFTGDLAQFDPPVLLNESGTYYNIHVGRGNPSPSFQYTRQYKSGSFPQNGVNINWVAKADNTTSEFTNVVSIGTALANETEPADKTPNIVLNSPTSANYTSPQSVTINLTAWDDININNVSIYVNSVINQTNTSGINNSNYLFDLNLGEGNWNIYGEVFDSANQSNTSDTIQIIIDSTNPSVNLINPTNSTFLNNYSTGNNNSVAFNWSITDLNLDSCWYTNDSGVTNYSITCGDNSTIIYLPYGFYTYTFYANDTFGNEASDSVSFTYDYAVLENAISYNPTTHETFEETYNLNLSLANGVSLTQAYFYYNGSRYNPNIYSFGDIRIINYSLIIPKTNSSYNATFFWEVTTDVGAENSTQNTQVVNTLKIDNCSVNTYVILNYTIYDEDARAILGNGNNITSNLYVQLTGDEDGVVYNYYSGTATGNKISICADNDLVAGQEYRLDALIQYTAQDYVSEYNYIEDTLINTSVYPLIVDLYLLAANNSQEFLITYKDSYLLPVKGAIIELTRQYPELGPSTFVSVENMKTDSDGKTIGHFVLNDVVYTIYVYVDGVLTATYENQRAFCTNLLTGDCQIELNEKTSTTNPQSYKNYLGVSGSSSYDKDNRELSFGFTSLDGSPKKINMSIYQVNGTTITNSICNKSLTSSAGEVTCSIPPIYHNETILVKIYVDDGLWSEFVFNLKTGFANTEVNAGKYILAFFLVTTLPLIAFTSGPMTLLFFIVGIFTAGALFLIDLGGVIGPFSAFLWFIIAAIILLIKSSNRSQQV